MDLECISTWYDVNSMTINVKKTQCMWFGSPQKLGKAPKLNLKIGDIKLQEVNSYKYLGATLDSELNLTKFADNHSESTQH